MHKHSVEPEGCSVRTMTAADTLPPDHVGFLTGAREVKGRGIHIYVASKIRWNDPDPWDALRADLPHVGDQWACALPKSEVDHLVRDAAGHHIHWYSTNNSMEPVYSGVIGSYDPEAGAYPVTRYR